MMTRGQPYSGSFSLKDTDNNVMSTEPASPRLLGQAGDGVQLSGKHSHVR
jgi:hypothetical protein